MSSPAPLQTTESRRSSLLGASRTAAPGPVVEAATLAGLSLGALVAPAPASVGASLPALAWCMIRLATRPSRLSALDATALALGASVALAFLLTPSAPGAGRLAGAAAALSAYVLVSTQSRELDRALRAARILLLLLGLGLVAEVLLLRGAYPPQALAPDSLTAVLQRLPDLRGDPLDMNARLVVHAYGIGFLALLGWALAVSWAVHCDERRTRASALALAVVFGALLALSQSRSALFAAVAVVPLIGAPRSRLWWLALPPALAVAVLLLATGALARSLEDDWLPLRLFAWQGSLHLLVELPFSGIGLGMRTVAERFAAHYELPDPHTVSHAHNVFLQSYLEAGPLGFAALVGLLAIGPLQAYRAAAAATTPRARALAAAVCGALAGSALYGLTDAVPTSDLGMVALFSFGALLAPLAPPRPGPGRSRCTRWALLAALGATGVGLGLFWPRVFSAFELNRAALLLADSAVTQSQARSAVDAASQAVQFRPADPAALRYQARAYLAAGDVAAALRSLDAARTLPLGRYEAFQLGRVFAALGQPGDTVALWIRAGERKRLARWASDLIEVRRYNQAEQIYRALLADNPNDADTLGELGVLLLRRRADATEAIGLLERAVQLDGTKRAPLGEYLEERGATRLHAAQRGDSGYDDAVAWLRAAVAVQPGDPAYRVTLARALIGAGRLADARRELEQALALDPSLAAARQLLSQVANAADHAG